MARAKALSVLAPAAANARITRRALLSGFVVLGAAATLSGCARGAMAASVAPDGAIESQLNVYSWGDYDDPDNIKGFHDGETVVQLDSYASNEELIAKLGASRGTSGYDIVVPSGQYVPQMVANGLLQELDHALLPNLANLDPAHANQNWDPGNRYTVCKNWGTTGFVYDRTVIARELTSWSDFLDAALNEASGETAVMEDPWEVTCIWFAAHGHDPNTVDPALLKECEEYLAGTLSPHVKAFTSTAAPSGIPQGSFALMHSFNGDARQGLLATDEPDRWKFVYPTPTANIWMDTWAIAAGAANADAAYAFINYMLDPDISLREVNYIGYHTGITGIEENAVAEGFELPELVFPDPATVGRLVPAQLNEATEQLVEILDRMRARAGA